MVRRKLYVQFDHGHVANLFRMHANGTLKGNPVATCCKVMTATLSEQNSNSVDLDVEAEENEIDQLPGRIADRLRMTDLFKPHVETAAFIQEAA